MEICALYWRWTLHNGAAKQQRNNLYHWQFPFNVLYTVHLGPLARYVRLWVAHAPGMPETFSRPPQVSDPDTYHGTCVTHVPWCMPGSLSSGFLWSRWRQKRSRHSRCMRNPSFYVSGKRTTECTRCAEKYITEHFGYGQLDTEAPV